MRKTRKQMWIVLLLAMISCAAGVLRFPTALLLRWTKSAVVAAPLSHLKGNVPVGGTQPHVFQALSNLPLHFEANLGQTNSLVNFFSRGLGYTLFLTPTESVMVLSPPAAAQAHPNKRGARRRRGESDEAQATAPPVLRMKLVGANPKPPVTGLHALSGRSNYFLGSDPKKWRTNVLQYAQVEYRDVYPGVDLVYYGNQGQLEHDFVVAPGADPAAILLSFSGADNLEVDSQGDLVLNTPLGSIRQQKPVVYQEVNGIRQAISGGYVLKGSSLVAFQLGAYDATRALVIDPVLIYSTYLGGAGEDRGLAIAADAAGNAYLAGRTNSVNFPIANAAQPNYRGDPFDVFVTKLNADGSALVYSTYLGGSGDDEGFSIALDGAGNAYITGLTSSMNFPTANALQPNYGGGPYDAFVTKLSADGSALLYSTYLGGSGDDEGFSLALDGGGNAYLTGVTTSTNFPTASALQPNYGGDPYDAFVTKLTADGSALIYSTYLGGSGDDEGLALAADSGGNAYITGLTSSTNFPTANALQPNYGGDPYDAFVTKLNADGSALIYSTYVGGTGDDEGLSLAADGSGNVYLTGVTSSTNFPAVNALQPKYGGDPYDAFVTKLNADGSALLYSTYIGGSGDDEGFWLALDSAGNAYLTGRTSSNADFPLSNPLQPTYGGGSFDAFVAVISADGSGLFVSSYLGGSGLDVGISIAVDASGNAYVAGHTNSRDFPVVNPLQRNYGGGPRDAFVLKAKLLANVGIYRF